MSAFPEAVPAKTKKTKTPKGDDKPAKGGAIGSPLQSKPRKAVIGAAVALIVIAALLFAWLLNTQSQNITVFAAGNDMPRGHTITAQDLTAVQIPDGQPIPHLSATDQGALVGKTAMVDLPSGTLLNDRNTGTGPNLPEDQSMVGLSLTGSQLPPYPLTNGDTVRVVATPAAQGDVPQGSPPASIPATVVSTERDNTSGETRVAIQVAKTNAPTVAAMASTGRVALIVDGSAAD